MPTRRSEKYLIQPGSTLAGRYRIDRMLGRGGFAEVYLGRHVEVDSLQVAIKVLHASHRDRDVILGRFRREARLLALLRNRHTVRLIDFGFTDDGMGYLVMEYVRGASLERLIKESAPMRATDVARVGIGVLKALDEAHSIGVIHRDLKPANVLLVNEPGERHAVPRVLDFGIAKVLGVADALVAPDGGESVEGTRADMVFCTPLYAAPELLRGKPDFRTDLYALGLVLAEMLDGATPYSPEDCAKMDSPHLSRTPVPLGPRTLSSGLGEVIRRACAKRLSERYASAVEMLADLEIAYDEIREPDYRESPLLIIPTPPQPVERDASAASSSHFVPASAAGADDEFDSIVHFLSEATRLVPKERLEALGAGAVVVDPIVDVPDAPGGVTHVTQPATRRRAVAAAALLFALLLGGAFALWWAGPPASSEPSRPVPTAAAPPAPVERPPTPVARAIDRASASLALARADAMDSQLVVRSDIEATVRLDGIPVGETGPDRALVLRGPTRRPFALELVAPGVVFTRMITEGGAVQIDARLAALRAETPEATPASPPPRTNRPRPARGTGAPAPPSPSTTADARPSLGDPIEPRTR